MGDKIIVFAIPGFLLLLFLEIIYCQYKKLPYYRFNDSMGNLTNGLGQLAAGIVTQLFFLWCYAQALSLVPWRMPGPVWLVWMIAFVLQDFCYYWFHRASHRVNWMVGSHVVHHQSEEYNLSVALRQSWLTRVYGWVFYVPMALLGVPIEIYISTAAINLLFQFWVHTRLIYKLGFLEKILITPSHHRVHHGKNQPYIDKNYAGVFIIWDRMFGTFQEELEHNPVQYGTITPVHSWNPFWANIRYYVDLWKISRATKSWKDKLWLWWSTPEWRPSDAPNLPKPQGRYDLQRSSGINILMVIQYTVCLLLFLYVTATAESLGLAISSLWAVMVLWGLSNIGGILDQRGWTSFSQIAWMVGLITSAGLTFSP
jgi:alkylglycerol monooxygenase